MTTHRRYVDLPCTYCGTPVRVPDLAAFRTSGTLCDAPACRAAQSRRIAADRAAASARRAQRRAERRPVPVDGGGWYAVALWQQKQRRTP